MCYLRILIILIINFISLVSFASVGNLRLIDKTIKHIEGKLVASVLKAEKLFEQNGGASISEFSMIELSDNPYVKSLVINEFYDVILKFRGDKLSAGTHDAYEHGSSPNLVAPVLRGITIKLHPVYSEGDAVITSWECLTNADSEAKTFIGHTVPIGDVSYITKSKAVKHSQYLRNCVYITFDEDEPVLVYGPVISLE